jgi:Tfp pilus assembly protein PilN
MHPKLQRIVTGSLFAGLEIQFLADGMILHLVVLKKKGQQLVVDKMVQDISDLDLLADHLSKNIPLAVAFTGKGILHRRVASDPAGDPKLLLSKVLPNASAKEFYLQIVPAAQDEQYISVFRKSAVDEMLVRLNQFSLVACSFGPFAVINSLALLGDVKDKLQFGNHTLHLQDNLPEEVQFTESSSERISFTIGGQNIGAELLVAFSAAFQQLLPPGQNAAVQVESLNSAKEEFLQRKLFLTGGKFLLVIILLLLLGNYFSFSHYWSEKNNLDAKLQTDGGALAGLRELEKQVEVKRSFLEQAGLLRSSSPSYYADQLAAELPDEISLTRMNLAPRLKLSEEDSIAFKPGHIEIDGSCSQSVVLNTWLQSLKTKKWIKSAILQSYVQDKNMKQGEFEIALVLE